MTNYKEIGRDYLKNIEFRLLEYFSTNTTIQRLIIRLKMDLGYECSDRPWIEKSSSVGEFL